MTLTLPMLLLALAAPERWLTLGRIPGPVLYLESARQGRLVHQAAVAPFQLGSRMDAFLLRRAFPEAKGLSLVTPGGLEVAALVRAQIAKLVETKMNRRSGGTSGSTSVTLRGVEIVDHWMDPEDVVTYAKAHLGLTGAAAKRARKRCPAGSVPRLTWTWRPLEGEPLAWVEESSRVDGSGIVVIASLELGIGPEAAKPLVRAMARGALAQFPVADLFAAATAIPGLDAGFKRYLIRIGR